MYNFSKAIQSIFRYKLFKDFTEEVTILNQHNECITIFSNAGISLTTKGESYYYESPSKRKIESKSIIEALNNLYIKALHITDGDIGLKYKIVINTPYDYIEDLCNLYWHIIK